MPPAGLEEAPPRLGYFPQSPGAVACGRQSTRASRGLDFCRRFFLLQLVADYPSAPGVQPACGRWLLAAHPVRKGPHSLQLLFQTVSVSLPPLTQALATPPLWATLSGCGLGWASRGWGSASRAQRSHRGRGGWGLRVCLLPACDPALCPRLFFLLPRRLKWSCFSSQCFMFQFVGVFDLIL